MVGLEARSNDKAHSIKASGELIRLENEEKLVAELQADPIEILKQIAEDDPLIALLLYESECPPNSFSRKGLRCLLSLNEFYHV